MRIPAIVSNKTHINIKCTIYLSIEILKGAWYNDAIFMASHQTTFMQQTILGGGMGGGGGGEVEGGFQDPRAIEI